MELNQIYQMDCLDGLKQLPDESVDLVVTDPPYGLKFMGKNWDKALPDPDVFKECLRVLKPGAFAFVMSAPRSDLQSRMSLLLEDAGFSIAYTPIYWTFASGFPKAGNIGKMVDKRLGKEREVIGTKRNSYTMTGSMENDYGTYKEQKDENNYRLTDVTAPASPEAKALDGSYAGFQPKPAVEVVIVAMKPLSEKTYVDQALGNGKGVTWLDDCRVPYDDSKNEDLERGRKRTTFSFNEQESNVNYVTNNNGRFPANLLVSDDVLNDGIDRKTGDLNSFQKSGESNINCYGKYSDRIRFSKGDSGSFSRYFSLDAWAQKNLPESVLLTYPFLLVPKASKSEKNKGCEGLPAKFSPTMNDGIGVVEHNPKIATPKNNHHPTVKPLKLMTYLITLGSREQDTILDPYAGSGTTCIAAKLLKRNYIGFELEPEYKIIADARLQAHEVKSQISLTAF